MTLKNNHHDLEYELNKKCKKCGKYYVLTEENFHKNIRSKDGFSHHCKFCKNLNKSEFRKNNKRSWREVVLNSVKSRKKKQYISPDINYKFLEDLKENQNGLCYWLKIPIDFSLVDKMRRPSLDRLDNSKGYIKENVVLCTQFSNLGRQSEYKDNYRVFLDTYIIK